MSLMLHTGAEVVDFDALRQMPTPEATPTHVPIAHSDVVLMVKYSLGFFGHEIVQEDYGVTPDGMRFFGAISLKSPTATTPTWWVCGTVTTRNSPSGSASAVASSSATTVAVAVPTGWPASNTARPSRRPTSEPATKAFTSDTKERPLRGPFQLSTGFQQKSCGILILQAETPACVWRYEATIQLFLSYDTYILIQFILPKELAHILISWGALPHTRIWMKLSS